MTLFNSFDSFDSFDSLNCLVCVVETWMPIIGPLPAVKGAVFNQIDRPTEWNIMELYT